MNNNIKEILDKLKDKNNFNNIFEGQYGGPDYYYFLEKTEANILLDYITNLQEENDILKRNIEAMKHNYNLLVRLIENGESITQKFVKGLQGSDKE